MSVTSTLFHLLGALRRAVGRVLVVFILFAVISAAIVEALAHFALGHNGPPEHIAAVIVGLVVGYAAALTVLVGEAIHLLVEAIQTVEKDVQSEVSGGVKILDQVIKTIEGKR